MLAAASRKVLFWTPRLLSIVFALFIGLFALDVFSEGYTLWEAARGFLIHLMPALILLLVAFLAWRWELVGVLVYTILGVFYLVMTWGREYWSAYAAIAGPLFLLALLYLLNWLHKARWQG